MRKAAKVYEANEAVEGMKPKAVYESHKKCTPGEFGARVKEALVKAAASDDDEADDDKAPASSARNDRKRRAKNRAEDLVPMKGFGRGYADYMLPLTFGGTRAGRATMIAKALGQKPDFSVSNPQTDQMLSAAGGGIVGGLGGAALGGLGGLLAASRTGHLGDAAAGAIVGGGLGGGFGLLAGGLGSGMERREQMQKIQDSLAGELEQHGTSRLKLDAPQYSALSSVLQPWSGAHRAGQADAYEALRDNTRYAKTPWRTAGYIGSHIGHVGPLIAAGHGMAQNFSARDRMKQEQVPMPIDDEFGLKEFGRAKAKAAAYVFGARVKQALSHAGLNAVGLGTIGGVSGGMYGGLAGVLGGGLHGAISPGNTTKYDDNGNVVGQKRRNRLMGALRGGLGYGALGAGAGATVGALGGMSVENFAPGTFQKAIGDDAYNAMHGHKANRDIINNLQELKESVPDLSYRNYRPPSILTNDGDVDELLNNAKERTQAMLRHLPVGPGQPGSMQEQLQNQLQSGKGGLFDKLKANIPERVKKNSAYGFGSKVALSLNELKNPALGGAAVGALAGGVHGLLSPGEDEDGKKRNRFRAMLRGVAGGGAIGGIGGAAAGAIAPTASNDFINKLLFNRKRAPIFPPQSEESLSAAYGEEPRAPNPAMQFTGPGTEHHLARMLAPSTMMPPEWSPPSAESIAAQQAAGRAAEYARAVGEEYGGPGAPAPSQAEAMLAARLGSDSHYREMSKHYPAAGGDRAMIDVMQRPQKF